MKIKFQVPVHIHWYENDMWDEATLPPTLQLLEYVADELNHEGMTQYSDGLVKSYKAYFTNDYKLWVECVTSRPKAAMDWWAGQFSDGWGEGFEQQEISAHNFYRGKTGFLSISTWEEGDEYKYIVLDKSLKE